MHYRILFKFIFYILFLIESYYSKEINTNNQNANCLFVKESEVHEERYFCKYNCNANKTSCIPYYNFMLVCRENAFSNTFIKLNISSFDFEGVKYLFNFFISTCLIFSYFYFRLIF